MTFHVPAELDDLGRSHVNTDHVTTDYGNDRQNGRRSGPGASGAGYGWLVIADDGTDAGAVIVGPDTITAEVRERLLAGAGERFRMGETVSDQPGMPSRSGRRGRRLIYDTGRYLGPTVYRFAPLLEYGFTWSGARWIEYARDGQWIRQPGLWCRPAWWRCVARHRRYWLAQVGNPLLRRPRG